MAKSNKIQYNDNQIRQLMLKYFYDINKNASSLIGKKKSSARSISNIRSDLKSLYGLKQNEVISNLTYLISQGWIGEKPISKSFPTTKGTIIPSITIYYIITAAGIDKIDGPTEFTRDKFSGIKIEATGQNIITLGDGNKINAKFEDAGNALNELKEAVKLSEKVTEDEKVDVVVDIESIQDQLAKPNPNKSVLKSLWNSLGKLATIDGLIELYHKVEVFILPLMNN
ncbi:MAG TPA: hypothetical protein VIK14_03705 [Ignavibacteria bacterium]